MPQPEKSAIAKRGAKYAWLDHAGIRRPLQLHHNLGCPAALILTVTTVAILFFIRRPFIVIPIAIGIGIAVSYHRTKVFFRDIRCPKCRFNPTRRRSDGEPRQDYHKVLHQLERYEECPNCGDRGDPKTALAN